jgi:hypothetical protein
MTLLSALAPFRRRWCLAIMLAAAPAAGSEPFASMDLIWMRPAGLPGAPPPCARLLTFDLPQGWMSGDAAAVVVTAGAASEAAADRVAARLLAEETAVLRLPAGRGGGIGPCADAPLQPAGEVLGAVRALRAQAGAGLVVAIGLDAAGVGALDAAREDVAAAFLGTGGPRLAAAIALDAAAPPRFRRGAPMPVQEAWSARGPLLCAALRPLVGPEAAWDCEDALAPAGQEQASLRPPRR